ncbi:aspartate aminotransferase [Azospira sp. I13]|uniref:MalY/PatB family protein n=1 Tax=Azospira sp. I13 TaxID=1765050 RepID=UPI000D4AF94C|nr:PatB family C-S lyase [Azospira sp. I13]GBG03107.1 aspartate aminotransferase [Azospira sp. I13]
MSGAFDFDTPVERRGSDSFKWGRYAGREVLPLWVADMDFASPPEVLAALHARVDHGVFGYGGPTEAVVESVRAALVRDYGWAVEADWLVWLPGLVTGLNVACRALAGPGEAVATAVPVYPPFLSAPVLSERSLVRVPLACREGRWAWDWDALEAVLQADPRPRLLLLCHPHNPVGRAWQREELETLADLCERYDVLVCSDEIHADLQLTPGARHLPFACLEREVARRSVTLMAPSKTYNIPGLSCAFAVVPDGAIRRRFTRAMAGIVPHVNVLGLAACAAAYAHGGPWRSALLDYLRGNRDAVAQAVAALPGMAMTLPEATYLAWIDLREKGLADPAAACEAAGIGLSDGREFGAPGFVRLNFACPRSTLEQALARLARV